MHVLQDGKRALALRAGLRPSRGAGERVPWRWKPAAGGHPVKGEGGGSSGRGAGRVCACNVSAQQGTPQRVGVTPRKASSREEGQREVTAGEVGARAGQTVVTEEAAKAK